MAEPVTIGQIYSQQLPDDTDSEAADYIEEAFDRIEAMVEVMLVLARGSDGVVIEHASNFPPLFMRRGPKSRSLMRHWRCGLTM